MTSSGRCILLTGGAGFIGSHLAEALLSRHDQLIVVDNLNEFYPSSRKRANLEEVRRIGTFAFEEADIRDQARLHAIFSRYRPDAVIHLAALAGVRPSIERPLEYESVNVAGTANILELCREFGVQKLIFGSSSSVYGATSVAPFSENHMELRPISPYATTKLSAGLYLRPRYRRWNLEVARVCAQRSWWRPLRSLQFGKFSSGQIDGTDCRDRTGYRAQSGPRAETNAARRRASHLGGYLKIESITGI